jgi:hypothetical protein
MENDEAIDREVVQSMMVYALGCHCGFLYIPYQRGDMDKLCVVLDSFE